MSNQIDSTIEQVSHPTQLEEVLSKASSSISFKGLKASNITINIFNENQTPINRNREIIWVIKYRGATFMLSNEANKMSKATPVILPFDARLKLALGVSPTDIGGHPAQIDGVVQYFSSDLNKAKVEVNPDGSVDVIPTRDLGPVQIGASADADLGDGITTISGFLNVEVVSGKAVSLSLDGSVYYPAEQAPEPDPVPVPEDQVQEPPLDVVVDPGHTNPSDELPVQDPVAPVLDVPVDDTPDPEPVPAPVPGDDVGEAPAPDDQPVL